MSEAVLYRAGAILSRVWLIYREETFEAAFGKLYWKDESNMVVEAVQLGMSSTRKRPGGLVTAFPEQMCLRSHDKSILLNLFACCLAAYHMQDLVVWLLQGLVQNIELVAFSVSKPPIKVWHEYPDTKPITNIECEHMVYKLTTSSGRVYALDFTGAQYGWFAPICTWEELIGNRCQSETIRSTKLLRYDSAELIQGSLYSSWYTRMAGWRESVTKYFYLGMKEFMDGQDPKVVMTLSEREVQSFEDVLLNQAKIHAEQAGVTADAAWEDIVGCYDAQDPPIGTVWRPAELE